MVRLTFFGSGTSQGVPVIGCDCPVCRSTDPHDKRLRSSVFVEYDGLQILVDAGPDFRTQMLRAGVRHLDAILLTHNHKDHTGGLDDVRALNYTEGRACDIYCESYVEESLRREYSYAFAAHKYPGVPEWHIHNITAEPFKVRRNDSAPNLEWISGVGYREITPAPEEAASEKEVHETTIIPIRGLHGSLPVLGFRFGDIAYCTDMNYIPEEEFEKLQGLEHFIINTVKRGKHNSHWGLEQAEEVCRRVGARHSWLTHLSDRLPRYRDFIPELEALPANPDGSHPNILPAYDGLVLEA